MSLFNWFSSKPAALKTPPADDGKRINSTPVLLAVETIHTQEERKLRRHARREVLYTAIRESMTRAGVLSTGYKFKVLSLDQTGNEFLVMMDLLLGFDGGFEQLVEMEGLIQRSAQARYGILVPTVYWRRDGLGAAARPTIEVKTDATTASKGNPADVHPATAASNNAVLHPSYSAHVAKPPPPLAAVTKTPAADAPDKPVASAAAANYSSAVQARFSGLLEPLPTTPAALSPTRELASASSLKPAPVLSAPVTIAQSATATKRPATNTKPASAAPRQAVSARQAISVDEVAAFRQALLAASAKAPPVAVENGVKVRSGPRSYTLLTGFEDTEMPDSHGQPALGKTQYGDLV